MGRKGRILYIDLLSTKMIISQLMAASYAQLSLSTEDPPKQRESF